MKVGVIIIAYNIPTDIFVLQIGALKKFCKDDYEVKLIDNSSDFNISADLEYHARELGISYKKTFASSHNGSDSHAFAANTAYNLFKDTYSYLFYIDHDNIPIAPFSVVDILGEDKVMAGIGQNEINTYIWPGCLLIANDRIDKTLVDFTPSHALTLDTGAGLRNIISTYGRDKIVFFGEEYHQNPNFTGQYNFYTLIYKGTFMHFVNASGWNPVQGNGDRLNSLIDIAREKINSTPSEAV